MSLSKPTKITTCLWFDGRASEAASHYITIFPNSRITHTTHYTATGQELHGQTPGSVQTVSFTLDGHAFVGLNGGPHFKFSEAVSFMIECNSQEQVDHYWERLGEGGDPAKQQCGWVADKFGLSWQVTPKVLFEYLSSEDKEAAGRAAGAMMGMRKLEIEGLKKAFEGKE